ncbi:carboxypeptidase D-like isoform X1 [Dermatophagoides pteronyssinus]|uniref:carboxypeptidase D-like isoform X1 n=2 Tax=Dermatophagoides pteronyssinus TaxID=6956 RepID=UPI003F675ECF
MRFTNVVMWSFFTAFFLLYLMAIRLVRGQFILSSTTNHPQQQKFIDFNYHNHESMETIMRTFAQTYPKLCQLYSIGKSVQGRNLWVLLITKNPSSSNDDDTLLKPNVKYVANMHGNEAVGRELLLHLIEYLLTNYENDPYIRSLVDNTRIHLMPSMNPDGFESSREGQCIGGNGRFNMRGIDLNRNFPDKFTMRNEKEQEEVSAIRRWLEHIPFVLSANLHGGALVASYPYDNTPVNMLSRWKLSYEPSLTPDNDVFKHLAEVYSFNHQTMYQGKPCPDGSSESFPNGTTNGAKWYPFSGGMQDYNYVHGSCMEITLELSCCKYPPHSQLPEFWRQNKNALIAYLNEVHRGLRGLITDQHGQPVANVQLKIKGRDIPFKSTKRGEFWRILLPGNYQLQAKAIGYQTLEKSFQINDGQITYLNLELKPSYGQQLPLTSNNDDNPNQFAHHNHNVLSLPSSSSLSFWPSSSSTVNDHSTSSSMTTLKPGINFGLWSDWSSRNRLQQLATDIFGKQLPKRNSQSSSSVSTLRQPSSITNLINQFTSNNNQNNNNNRRFTYVWHPRSWIDLISNYNQQQQR